MHSDKADSVGVGLEAPLLPSRQELDPPGDWPAFRDGIFTNWVTQFRMAALDFPKR